MLRAIYDKVLTITEFTYYITALFTRSLKTETFWYAMACRLLIFTDLSKDLVASVFGYEPSIRCVACSLVGATFSSACRCTNMTVVVLDGYTSMYAGTQT